MHHLLGAGGLQFLIDGLSARFGVVVESGTAVFALGMQSTTGASWSKSVLLKILESDLDPSGLLRVGRAMLINSGVSMGLTMGFNKVKMSSALSKGRGANTQHPVCIPTGLWNEANDGAGTDNVSAVQANDVLITVDRTSKENPIPPNLIKF